MPEKIGGEIDVNVMEDILKSLPTLNSFNDPDYSILIHGFGGQTRSFYNELKSKNGIKLLWTDWCGKAWWSYIFSFISGQAGLIKVLDIKQLDTILFDIGANGICGLYFIPNNKIEEVLEGVKQKNGITVLENILETESNYFFLIVDIDYQGGRHDGEIFYRELVIGDNLDAELKKAITRT